VALNEEAAVCKVLEGLNRVDMVSPSKTRQRWVRRTLNSCTLLPAPLRASTFVPPCDIVINGVFGRGGVAFQSMHSWLIVRLNKGECATRYGEQRR